MLIPELVSMVAPLNLHYQINCNFFVIINSIRLFSSIIHTTTTSFLCGGCCYVFYFALKINFRVLRLYSPYTWSFIYYVSLCLSLCECLRCCFFLPFSLCSIFPMEFAPSISFVQVSYSK